ncbi:glucosaminidase domain-containing protein [Vibrio makurazakiensis]|uniref:glucosaminidase domain-containing protein n=1 Tax=Vibrio makurazakiensis TaxID=2910250 RepID=UPI003D10A48B
MRNKITSKVGFRLIAISAFGAFSAIGPYIYETEERRTKKSKSSEIVTTQSNSSDTSFSSTTPDFASISDTKQKKQAFFDYLRPSIALENNRILKERSFLERLAQDSSKQWTAEQTEYAKRLGKLYSMPLKSGVISESWITEMLAKANILPEALVLTQAANESGWGTSRFAKEANNFFGQWCYTKGCGVVPLHRNEGSSHEVAKFSSIQESVHRYFMNVNRNQAYADLRTIRADLVKQGEDLSTPQAATQLTDGLLKYSERGADYVTDLQAMIRHNSVFWTQP